MAPSMLALVVANAEIVVGHNMILTFTSYAVAMEEVAIVANTEEMNRSFMMIGFDLQALNNIMSS